MDLNDKPLQPTFSEDGTYLCPICGSDNVHLQAVEVNAGGVVTRIDNQYPVVREGPPWGRGALIKILCWAECGHSWTRQIYFHKGQTTEELIETKQNFDQLTDLWRE